MSVAVAEEPAQPGTPASQRAAAAGLAQVGIRPGFLSYLGQVWTRRQFAWMLARSRVAARSEGDILGALWNVLRPVLTAAVYWVVFDQILKSGRGVHNFVTFLSIGVFMFTYTQSCLQSGAKAISGNLTLVRALHFPRAVLPLATILDELISLIPVLGVMMVLSMATGEWPSPSWLLLIPLLLLQTLFNLGLALVFARLTSRVRDVSQLLPFATRLWLYLSGVFYSIEHRSHGWPTWARVLMEYNPGNIIITAYRGVLMHGYHINAHQWIALLVWSLGLFTLGALYFWRGEETYGRG